jgi:hypothetical protein
MQLAAQEQSPMHDQASMPTHRTLQHETEASGLRRWQRGGELCINMALLADHDPSPSPPRAGVHVCRSVHTRTPALSLLGGLLGQICAEV